MVKLDVNVLRYMTKDEFRVLTAVEMGQKNHEFVPTALISRIAGLKHGGAYKVIKLLHKNKLVFHEAKKYDGYRLTCLGYDYLALRTFVYRGLIHGIGRKIGVGKESDIYEVINEEGEQMVLKIHRLGRISFRAVKSKRDYLLHRSSASWLYLSRLAALREFHYMKSLHNHGFPTPIPYDCNRHCVLMSFVDAFPLYQVKEIKNPKHVSTSLMKLIVRLAEHGLIHCDFNEFNLMLSSDEQITMIDFPQMVSTSHRNAQMYFERDVECIRTYFQRKHNFECVEYPKFSNVCKMSTTKLDVALRASGAKKHTHTEGKQQEKQKTETSTKSNINDDGKNDNDNDKERKEKDDDRNIQKEKVEQKNQKYKPNTVKKPNTKQCKQNTNNQDDDFTHQQIEHFELYLETRNEKGSKKFDEDEESEERDDEYSEDEKDQKDEEDEDDEDEEKVDHEKEEVGHEEKDEEEDKDEEEKDEEEDKEKDEENDDDEDEDEEGEVEEGDDHKKEEKNKKCQSNTPVKGSDKKTNGKESQHEKDENEDEVADKDNDEDNDEDNEDNEENENANKNANEDIVTEEKNKTELIKIDHIFKKKSKKSKTKTKLIGNISRKKIMATIVSKSRNQVKNKQRRKVQKELAATVQSLY